MTWASLASFVLQVSHTLREGNLHEHRLAGDALEQPSGYLHPPSLPQHLQVLHEHQRALYTWIKNSLLRTFIWTGAEQRHGHQVWRGIDRTLWISFLKFFIRNNQIGLVPVSCWENSLMSNQHQDKKTLQSSRTMYCTSLYVMPKRILESHSVLEQWDAEQTGRC